MSLMEDVFLQDEAGEAQELERIIEGNEYDEQPRSRTPNSDDDSEKDDEAEEDKRHVDPVSAKPKHVVRNPRFILNPARLTGPRGIQLIPDHFKQFKFKGKGHERDDLDMVLKKLEHWAYRLYPKFQFEDCLKKIETLGKKRPVMVHLHKIRTDQFLSEETVVQKESSVDEAPASEDEFDKLLQQQIDLARATPAQSAKPPVFSTPMVDRTLAMTKATSSPSISEDQRQRIIRNRQLAEERRLARLKQNTSQCDPHLILNNKPEDINNEDNEVKGTNDINKENETNKGNEISEVIDDEYVSKLKTNRSNVIESSDEEDSIIVKETVTVDVHNTSRNDNMKNYNNVEKNGGNINGKSEIIDMKDNSDINNDITREKLNENITDKNFHNNEESANNIDEISLNAENTENNTSELDVNQGSIEVTKPHNDKSVVSVTENMDVDFSDDFL